MAAKVTKLSHKFADKLILNQWLISLFGIDPLLECKDKTRPFHKLAAPIKDSRLEGYDADGLHRFYHELVSSELFYNDFHSISKEQLLIYEENIVSYTNTINSMRSRPIIWKYFQWLTLLFVEVYLDRYFSDKEKLLEDLNSYIKRFNGKWADFNDIEPYALDDLNKLCIQSATGSGKTLLMHVNLLQFRYYAEKHNTWGTLDSTILITPNERMTEQHITEFRESGFSFVERLNNKSSGSIDYLYVVEITKLGDRQGPNIIATSSRGYQNLLLVDEGHKGMSAKEEGAFFKRRADLSEKGFVFEYSATFLQAVNAAKSPVLESSYSKSILFDYSYKWFYEDGFGKDFQILNLPETFQMQTELYLTACLLKFYQQLRIYQEHTADFIPFNIEKPLWIFIGSTVSKVKGSNNDEKNVIADVAKVIHFLADFVYRQSQFQKYIEQLLSGNGTTTGLIDENGYDVFFRTFDYIATCQTGNSRFSDVYFDILERVFNNRSGGILTLEKIKGDSGEIALLLGNSDPFGLINVGDAKGLCDHLVATSIFRNVKLEVVDSEFSEATFDSIKDSSSTLNLLIGSRKFIEGWDCWRVSTIGLMHFGQGEGSQIIQLFGRGVRLKGYQWSLKRSPYTYATAIPAHIKEIETINVFGIEANFMKTFRDMLVAEGLPDNKKSFSITIPMNVTKDIGKKLKILRPKKKKLDGKEYDFKKDGPIPTLGVIPQYLQKNQVVSDWYPRIQAINPTGKIKEGQKTDVKLQGKQISLLDMDSLYFDLERYKREKSMYNLNISKQGISTLLSDTTWYQLYLPVSRLSPQNYSEVLILQQIATELLRRYAVKYYNYCNNAFISPRLELRELTREDDNLPSEELYKLFVDGDDTTLIQQLTNLKQEIIDKKEELLPVRYLNVTNFGNHLFQPLFYVQKGGNITILPIALGESEYQFITDLKDWCDKNRKDMKDKGQELYLLRNLSRGMGVGFFEAGNFHPDFILWILSEGKQYVHFIEPHGLMHEGINSDKIQFHKRIKEIESRLGDPNVILSSWILSWTPKQELKLRGYNPDEYLKNNVVFMEDDGYIHTIINLEIS